MKAQFSLIDKYIHLYSAIKIAVIGIINHRKNEQIKKVMTCLNFRILDSHSLTGFPFLLPFIFRYPIKTYSIFQDEGKL